MALWVALSLYRRKVLDMITRGGGGQFYLYSVFTIDSVTKQLYRVKHL